MSLQDILKKITDDSQKVIKQIEAEAELMKKDIVAQYKEKEELAHNDLQEKTKKVVMSMDDKIRLVARRENSKRTLEVKQEIIQKALELLLESLETADDILYGKILKQLFKKVTEKEGKVFVSPKRVDITRKCLPVGFNADVVSDEEVKGGFIFRGKQIEIDNSFHELIFSEFRSDLTTYFAEQLRLI